MDIGHLQPVTLIDEFWRRSVFKSPVNKREKFPMVGVIYGVFFHTSSLCYFVKTWLLLYLPLEHQQMTKTWGKILGQVDDTFTISFGAWRPESVRVANSFFFYVARIMDYFNNSITPRLHSERTRTGRDRKGWEDDCEPSRTMEVAKQNESSERLTDPAFLPSDTACLVSWPERISRTLMTLLENNEELKARWSHTGFSLSRSNNGLFVVSCKLSALFDVVLSPGRKRMRVAANVLDRPYTNERDENGGALVGGVEFWRFAQCHT